MNQRNVIAFCSIAVLISCLNQKPNDNNKQVKPYPHIINMSEGFQNRSNLKLSDIADSIRYVVLSKDKEVLIGGIRSVQLTENYIYLKSDNLVTRFDLDGNQIKVLEHPLKNITISSTETKNIVSMAPSFTFFDNRVILAPEGDTIYEIDNNSITKGFIIDWGQIPHKQSIEELYFRQTETSNKVINYMPLLETSTKAFFRGKKSNDFYLFEYDKITGTSRSMTSDQDNLGFINDLDGGEYFYPYWTNRTGNIWIVEEDAFSFKEKHSKEFLSNSVALYPRMKERLKIFLDSLKQDDNPILKIVYLKNVTN